MTTIYAVAEGKRYEVTSINVDCCLSAVQRQAIDEKVGFDCYDKQGRVIATVSPKEINKMAWAMNIC